MSSRLQTSFRDRIKIVFLGLGLLWILLGARALQLKSFPGEKLVEAKSKQYQRVVKLQSRRGDIFDRYGENLAVSVPAYSLFADPSLIKNPSSLALKLSKVLKKPYRSLLKKLKKKTRFVWLDRLQSKEVHERIQSWRLRGLGYKQEYRRIYPKQELAAHVLGFVNRNNKGLEGAEAIYNEQLDSSKETLAGGRDARGRFLMEDGWQFAQKRDGNDVMLTLDSDLQNQVEQELKQALEHHEADGAWAVVLDPKTSEILAMASAPSFNLNRGKKVSLSRRRNKALHDIYEPGSTIKTLFMAAALEEGLIEPNSIIRNNGGEIRLNGHTIRESDKEHEFEKLTATEVLMYSSNVGVSKISLDMKSDTLYEYYQKFGLGKKTGVDLMGEGKGLLRKPPYRDHFKANMSFGHGMATTGLQIANAYAAIANGGVLNRPYIGLKQQGLDGDHYLKEPKSLGRIMSRKTSDQLKIMLVAVTGEKGTGSAAQVRGFPVAGKTGTAQKVRPDGKGYLRGEYISSFAGFIPANDPQFVIYVAIDNPKKNGKYASKTAAPVFSRIAEYAVIRKGLAPVLISSSDLLDLTKYEALAVRSLNLSTKGQVPNMTGWTLRDVLRFRKESGLKIKIKGSKTRVSRTEPSMGSLYNKGDSLRVVF